MVYIALVVHGSQFEVRLQLATVVEDGVGGEECGLFGDEGTLLHQVGQSSPLFARLWPFAFSAADFTFSAKCAITQPCPPTSPAFPTCRRVFMANL